MTSLESHYALEAELPANPGYYIEEESSVCADCIMRQTCPLAFTNGDDPEYCPDAAEIHEHWDELYDRRAVMNGTSLY